jgi:hypothetical protein
MNLLIIETQKIVVTATKIILTVFFARCVTNRCMGIYKFGNKYVPPAYKTQFQLGHIFSGEKVRHRGREIRYVLQFADVAIRQLMLL